MCVVWFVGVTQNHIKASPKRILYAIAIKHFKDVGFPHIIYRIIDENGSSND